MPEETDNSRNKTETAVSYFSSCVNRLTKKKKSLHFIVLNVAGLCASNSIP